MNPTPASNDPGDEWVDLIDEENRVIGRAQRRQVRRENRLHRGVGILCRNPRGEVYVHRRTAIKDLFPSMYDMFVGGVVGSGELPLDAARREISEELGIVGVEPRFLFHHRYEGPRNRAWVAVYEVTWDGPIVHQPSEVEWGVFLSPAELEAKIVQWPFVPDGLEIYRRLVPDGSGVVYGKQSRVGSEPEDSKGAGGGGPPAKRKERM